MEVRLVLMRKRKRVWSAELHHTEATLGRARGCTVRIPSSQVSRLHCRLHIDNGVVTVEDLESVNGTYVNGKRVSDPEVVHPGDRLSVGPATFLVEYELTADEDALQEVSEEIEYEALATEAYVELIDDDSSSSATGHPETDAEVEVVEEANSTPPPKSAPKTQLYQVEEELDAETVSLLEQEDLQLSDSGNLRNLFAELENEEKSPKKRS